MSNVSTASSASTKSFVTALVFNLIVFSAEIAAFTIIRPYFKAIYEPRTYQPIPSKRIGPLSQNVFLWPLAVFKADYRTIIKANGMDAYFFVRFLRMMAKVFLPIWLLSWAVLLPSTSVNTSVDGHTGLDLFIFGNISQNRQGRYAAHLILVYIFTGWMFYNIKTEMRHFLITRQQHLIEPAYAKSVQANTILVTGIPAKYLNQAALRHLFRDLPGGVRRIWINRDLKELPDIYDRRMSACAKLESAETTLIKTAAKLRLKEAKAASKSGNTPPPPPAGDKPATSINSDTDRDVERDTERAAQLVPRAQRPSHRLGWIPFHGEKVDTIEWAREEIRVCNELLDEGRATIEREDNDNVAEGQNDSAEASADGHDNGKAKGKKDGLSGSYPPLNSAFITFNRQIAAHIGMQILTHHEPYRMSGKYVDVSPEDVIWGNLAMNPYEMKIRTAISYAATAGLIILWAFPVAFIGIISNITSLCTTYSWLAWLCKLPSVVTGIISGILPPVLLAVLMMLLPIILRLLARFEGIPKRTGLELSLMNRFFTFQVIHSFLIVTLASGIIAALPQLVKDPTSVPSLLAQQLPKASTFFLTYIILQGLSGVAGGFLQIVPLAIYYVKLYLLGSTPRAVFGIRYGARNVAWGTTFPGVTLLVVIALGYQIIAPIINGLACVTFFMFYQLYKYLFLWQYRQPVSSDTGGLFFPKAIQHVFVGMYVQQVCLAGLFFLAENEQSKPSAVPEGALMVVLIVATIGFQLIINNSYGPLLHALPLSLSDRTYDATAGANGSDEGLPRPSAGEDARPLVASSKAEEKARAETGVAEARSPDAEAQTETELYGFAHPAASRPQRIVWLPHDPLGLGDAEAHGCIAAGVRAETADAAMDEKGHVEIDGAPPGYVAQE